MKLNPTNWVIYYHLVKETKDIELYRLIIVLQRCFSMWATYISPIRFEPTSEATEAHIKIFFIHNGHPILLWHEFWSVVWFAYYPDSDRKGEVYLNDEKDWTSESLYPTLAHEISHSLGLKHSKDPTCITFGKKHKDRGLVPVLETILDLQEIYHEDIQELNKAKVKLSATDILNLTKPQVSQLAQYLRVEPKKWAILRLLYP